MNIKKLPTIEDYQQRRNWVVAATGLDGYFDDREGRYDTKARIDAIKNLNNSGARKECFADLRLSDIKRIVDDVSRIHPDSTEILHPSQHLAVNLPFSRALDMQEALHEQGLYTVIFPTSVY